MPDIQNVQQFQFQASQADLAFQLYLDQAEVAVPTVWSVRELTPTTTSAWPEDEGRELEAARLAGREIPQPATPRQAKHMLADLRYELPLRFPGGLVRPSSARFDTRNYDYWAFDFPRALLRLKISGSCGCACRLTSPPMQLSRCRPPCPS